MGTISEAIVKHKKVVVVLFVLLAWVFGIMSLGVSVNFNITDYLPAEAQSTKALDIMDDEFGNSVPNARVMIPVNSIEEAREFKGQLEQMDGVSDVLWLDNAADLNIPTEMMDTDVLKTYFKDGKAQYSVCVERGTELSTVDALYGLAGRDGALSGDAVNVASSQRMAKTEVKNAMVILIPAIIIILLLSTTSWMEPILFLAAMGVAVLINLGSNIFLGEVSYITNAISPILQLAVSLDYAIFLLHTFADCRKKISDVNLAMKTAVKKSLPTIAASAATTLFGFVALYFMDFRIGPDLSINLVKGILLSFLSAIFFLPALTLCFYKWIDKTRHKKILPDFKGIGGAISRMRIPLLLLVLALIIPSYLAQSRISFTYNNTDTSKNSRIYRDTSVIEETFGKSNAIVVLIPKGNVAKEKQLCDEFRDMEHVTGVASYSTMVGPSIPEAYLDESITDEFCGENYCRIILYTDLDDEGDTAFAAVRDVQDITRGYFGDDAYTLGQSVNLYDMKETVAADNMRINLIAIISIALVLAVTFRSLIFPVLLLLTIESAIWINLSIAYFAGSALCYIGYLVINTVQLGATVDYAILLTGHYRELRQRMNPKAAVTKALNKSFSPILISASILTLAGFCLYFTSGNMIISTLGLLLGRGTMLSFSMVICFLPGTLILFDKPIGKTTWRPNFFKEEKTR